MNEQNEQHEELTRVVEAPALKMGIFKRIIAVIISPGELMANIKEYPVILPPLILVIFLSLLSIPISIPYTLMIAEEMNNLMIERMLELGMDVSPLVAAAGHYGDAALVAAPNVNFLAIANAIIAPVIISAFAAIGFWILTKIMRGRAKFTQYFSMYMHVMIVVTIGAAVQAAIATSTGRLVDMTSLAAFIMPDGNISMVSFNILSAFNIFGIWAAVLTYIGVKIFNDFKIKAIVISAIAFLFGTAIMVAFMVIPFMMLNFEI